MNGDEMLKRLNYNVLDQDRFGNLTVTNASVQGKYLLISCENLETAANYSSYAMSGLDIILRLTISLYSRIVFCLNPKYTVNH